MRLARINTKKREKKKRKKRKGIVAYRAKPSTLILGTDALIGNEEQKKDEKERSRERDPNPVTMDKSAASYDPHGSYGGLILFPVHRE